MRNYEALKFISLCLSLKFEKKNISRVKEKLQSLEWEKIICISDAHYVFPNLYIQLKNTNLLDLVPDDLVAYMEFLTEKNRERNQTILAQIERITKTLNQENIIPIFTKGTSYLVDNLYEDLGERIIGDIDFLLPEKDIEKAAKLLSDFGYKELYDEKTDLSFHPEDHRHLPRLIHNDEIAAIEIHREMLVENHAKNFNYETIKDSLKEINFRGNKLFVLSTENQLILNGCSLQLNDSGYSSGRIILRNLYDALLLSEKVNSLETIEKHPKLFKYLNCYLALTKNIFYDISIIRYKKNIASRFYVSRCLLFFKNRKLTLVKNNLEIFFKIIHNSVLHLTCPKLRAKLIQKLTSKEWRKKKVIMLKNSSTRI
ncbi:nucleotidyltransferase family protein [Aureivirga sp. CE67]|uniref:nucleotidyltransferase family protein n=1 Tax=Aureivirga sp. CE67 TaxID=1788983 RepID=UPI0018C9183F|nr:nucleotidyltransferase family protein [Aureivirga sp. CE67]